MDSKKMVRSPRSSRKSIPTMPMMPAKPVMPDISMNGKTMNPGSVKTYIKRKIK